MKSAAATTETALHEKPDSDERWRHVYDLHGRNDAETFRSSAALLDSPDPARRELGVDILAQLGAGADERPFLRPAADLLLERIERENHADVLQAIATAFGHIGDPRCVAVLHGLRAHPSEDVRFGVVFGLGGHEDELAVDALIELSRDPDEDVRDWATFGLGSLTDRDDDRVRDALLARVDDPHAPTGGEALAGLALRGDERVIPHLLLEPDEMWELEDLGTLEGEALLAIASRSRDERLCAYVDHLHRAWLDERPDEPVPEDLRRARSVCGRGPRD